MLEFLRETTRIERTIAAAIALSVVLLLWVAVADERRWDAFVLEHQCRVIGNVSPSTGVGYSMGGNGGVTVVTIPGKTGWRCNNGQEYWR